jgi:hypothetical protein
MKEVNNGILENWAAIRTLVDQLEIDLRKTATGNKSAGVRLRKGLRELKSMTGELVKTTINVQKEAEEE